MKMEHKQERWKYVHVHNLQQHIDKSKKYVYIYIYLQIINREKNGMKMEHKQKDKNIFQ